MSNAIEQAYELGWRRSAEWSKRDDLLSDIGSPAYKRERDEDLAHLSAQAKVRAPNSGLPTELRLVCGHDSRSVDGCINCEAADAIEGFDGRLSQGSRSEAHPFIWFATDDNGSYGIGADRHSAISDLPFMARRVFPLYTHPAERAAVPDGWKITRTDDAIFPVRIAGPEGHVWHPEGGSPAARLALALLTAAPQPPEGARVVGGKERV